MLYIRNAKVNECETLTDIAIKSESYWGYDFDYMETFKSLYKVTEDFINNNSTFIIEEDENIVGFYGVLIEKDETSLEYLFIEPKCIGKGYGKLLWDHMVENCKKVGIDKIMIVTSPQAKDFYIKMGAVQTGEIESLVKKERRIPQLIYKIQR